MYALDYAAQVTSILTNYKTFGSSKFIPRVAKDKFRSIIANSPQAEEALKLWDKVRPAHLPLLSSYSFHSLRCQLEEQIYALKPTASLLVGKPNVRLTFQRSRHHPSM